MSIEPRIDVVRKAGQKHTYIRLYPPNRVRISTDTTTSDADLNNFVQAHRRYIATKLQEFQQYTYEPVHTYAAGDVFYLWGQPYTLAVRCGANKVTLRGDQILVQVPSIQPVKVERALHTFCIEAIKEAAGPHLVRYEKALGVRAGEVRFRRMTSRWGSCNTVTGALTLNTELVKRLPVALEYVVLHELAHLVVRGHNSDFYQLIKKYMPHYKDAEHVLKYFPIDRA
ncbi:SprT family zinc-dependent metalloprotease [Peptoniphilus equinus]|uniref:SprT family zinc-dependent metalloprotease n=1 Tax=Peptoniphilus equinus TaxID=3016343 RepID=A0ABY7QUG3_9FIRM|nr:SprT family zinc-dependent metalloprotease [Peptoniphilus equinus]WBW50409.1 SprT family zinc-dependent metalloprotease [Peptoniphilus equinus]